MDKNIIKLKTNNSKKYKIEIIYNSIVYIKELKLGYLSKFYFLIFWKEYLEERNT